MGSGGALEGGGARAFDRIDLDLALFLDSGLPGPLSGPRNIKMDLGRATAPEGGVETSGVRGVMEQPLKPGVWGEGGGLRRKRGASQKGRAPITAPASNSPRLQHCIHLLRSLRLRHYA